MRSLELAEIYAPLQADLARVEERLKSRCKVGSPYLSELLEYSLRANGGKRLRPMLTLLSGKFYHYNLDLLLPMATAVEIMHTATLIHDDAIDKSAVRRGRTTVYKLWGEEKAVLLGDYLFAEAGSLTASTQNLRAIKLFAETLKAISSGELNQSFNAFNLKQSRADYIQRVVQKTAALFVLSTESGAALSQSPEEAIQVLVEYGYNLGIAFQIVDDVLDFVATEKELGKPVGADLVQGTLTLPAMFLLEKYPGNNPVREWFEKRDNPEDIRRAIEMVRDSSIPKECYQVAAEYSARACRNLNQLPPNPAREILLNLADYLLNRRS